MRILFALLSLIVFVSSAAANITVEAVQMPVWLYRAGSKIPLSVAAELKDEDQIITGGNSRVLLKMADDSSVKLGENVIFKVGRTEKKNDLFTTSLDVLKGAFRYTTGVLGKIRKREVSVRVATVTIGIRGTDIWGRSEVDKDLVCLIEGEISVQRGDEAPTEMKTPMSFYLAPKTPTPQPFDVNDPLAQYRLPPPKDQKPLPASIKSVSQEQFAKWAAEVEIKPGQGAARAGGKWKINLISSANQDKTLSVYEQVRTNGYAAEIQTSVNNNKRLYTARLSGFPSKEEAQVLASKLKGQMGIIKPVISR